MSNNEGTNTNYISSKSFVNLSQIVTQINKELSPFHDKIDEILNQVQSDLHRISFDTAAPKLGHFPNNSNFTTNDPQNLWSKVSAYKSSDMTNYRPKIVQPSHDNGYWLNEKLPSYKCLHSCHYKELNCPHYKNFDCPNYKNFDCPHYTCGRCHHCLNFQNSFSSSSFYSLRGHRDLHLADNSRHLSLNDFRRRDSHSLHTNVLPVNSENLHQHYRSKVPSCSMRTCQAHPECKFISKQFATENCQKHSHLIHENGNSKKKYRKHKRKECCKNHRKRHYHRHISPKKTSSSELTIKNCSLNNIKGNESLETIKKINSDMKEIQSIKESMNYKQEVESGNSSSENTIKSEMMFSLKNSALLQEKKEEMEFQAASNPVAVNVLETEEKSSCLEKIEYSVEKDSSTFSEGKSIKGLYTEYKESIQVNEHCVRCDKACNTESIDVPSYQRKKPLNSKKHDLNTTEINGESRENENFHETSKFYSPTMKKIITTALESHVSENHRKSISSQHSKMNLSKEHERITIVPIIFYSEMNEKCNEKLNLNDLIVSGNCGGEKQIPLQVESQGRLLSTSDFSLSTRAKSFATEITQLAKKCAHITNTNECGTSEMSLKTDNSCYSFGNFSVAQIREGKGTRVDNETRAKNVSCQISSVNNETFENPARNSVTVRRIRGIITSPEDFMYE